jgi:hypothetical protein
MITLPETAFEKEWDTLFSESEDMLAQMADCALEEFNSNTTTSLTQNNFDFSCLQ